MTEHETTSRKKSPWWSKARTVALALSLIVATAGAPVTGYGYVKWGYGFGDSVAALVFSDHGTTLFTFGYTTAGFKSVRVGMTMEEVRRLLGPPLGNTGVGGDQAYSYSQSALARITTYG